MIELMGQNALPQNGKNVEKQVIISHFLVIYSPWRTAPRSGSLRNHTKRIPCIEHVCRKTTNLLKAEHEWIWKMNTVYSLGLNVNDGLSCQLNVSRLR